jgi:hypothetical protein
VCLQHPRICWVPSPQFRCNPALSLLIQRGRCLFAQGISWSDSVRGFNVFAIPPLLYYSNLDDAHTFRMEMAHAFATHFHGSEACQPQGTACATACGAPGACATGNACQGACPAPYLSVEPKAGQGGACASCMLLLSWQMGSRFFNAQQFFCCFHVEFNECEA